jgi:Flp pilus assembly protein TadD
MILRPRFAALALLLMAPLAQAIPDANGELVSPDAVSLADDPAMSARLNYNLGFERFEKTKLLETQSGKQSDIKEGYSEARDKFRKAAAADPAMKEAWNMVGYTSRRLGEYEASLSAYETALKLQPDYPEAIEYRAELFLLTGRLDDAKAAFTQLQGGSPSYAKVLLQSMRDWLAAQGKEGKTVPAAQRDALATWVAAQKVKS